jgi:hypothetical protein
MSNKHLAHMTNVFLEGKKVPFIEKLVITAVVGNPQFGVVITQTKGKETVVLEDGQELRVDEHYLGPNGDLNLACTRFDARAAEKAEAARQEDAKKLAAELKAQEEAKARAADEQAAQEKTRLEAQAAADKKAADDAEAQAKADADARAAEAQGRAALNTDPDEKALSDAKTDTPPIEAKPAKKEK